MKKLISCVLVICLAFTMFSFTAIAQDDISVIVNGKQIEMDQKPVLINDRTLVPMRAIFEALGAKVEWDNDTQTATGTLGEKVVKLQIENTAASVDGKEVTLDVPAKLISDRTMVPVRFISESLGAKVDWEDATQTVKVTLDSNGGRVMDFDSKTEFKIQKDGVNAAYSSEYDCRVGGGVGSKLVLEISGDEDHTSGSGKSLKIVNSGMGQARIKLLNTFSDSEITKDYSGKTFTVSYYAKSKTGGKILTGIMAAAHMDSMDKSYETQYYADGKTGNTCAKEVALNANEWQKISFDYTMDDLNCSEFQIALLAIELNETVAEIYIDDISVSEKSEDGENGNTNPAPVTSETDGIPNVLANPTDKRPVPTNFEKSNKLDDLIYYPMPEDADTAYSKLTGGKQVLSNDDLFNGKITTEGMPEYGSYEVVDVEGMPFKKAVRFKVTEIPEQIWMLNLRIYPELADKSEDDDVMLIKLYVRRISGGDFDTRMVKFNLSFRERTHKIAENKGGASADALAGDDWTVMYMPVKTNHEYGAAGNDIGFNPGSYVQELEIGGFEMVNYGKKYDVTDMPSSYGSYKGSEEDAQWRKDAMAKIEKIRKGDIKVIVKDEAGNIVPDAKVNVDMYEHEVNFACAINPTTLTKNETYRKVVVENFNSMATEGLFHRQYENQDDQPSYTELPKLINWAYANGCAKNVKGHALMWDTDSDGEEPGLDVYKSTKVGPYLSVLNDKAALDAKVKAHFEWMAKRFPTVTDWDVTNEDGSRKNTRALNTFKNIYGDDVLINWYKYAREIFPNATLELTDGFYSENQIFTASQKPFLDWAVKNLDFDCIGQQGHVSYTSTPENIIKTMEILESYGKKIHVTEFDTGTVANDQNYQANLVRDALIAYFSCEAVDTIQLWGLQDWSDSDHSKRIMYNSDYSLKPSGKEFQDLVYNKWWTREAGTTNANGEFATRGYYGDYTITAEKDGKKVSIDVPCKKGNDNTVTIVLK